MILLELKIIGINILFGIFALTILNALSLLINKCLNPYITNILYFLSTLIIGLIYIVYIDKVFLDFKMYFLLFILFGSILSSNLKILNISNNFPTFVYLNKTVFKFFKHLSCFMINYSFFKEIVLNIKIFLKKHK